MTAEPLLLSASDAAKMLGIGRSLFYEMHSKGRLGPMAISFGRKRLWSRLELQLWVKVACPPRDQWLRLKRASDAN
jgi:excisionase family DNA binding protein